MSFLAVRPRKVMRYVVQSLVPGTDAGVGVLCRDGRILAHATQRPISSVLTGYRLPTEIEMFDHTGAESLVRTICEALQWSGIANIDLRIDERDGSPSVIEVNPRYWSSLLASHAAGVDFPHLACLAALGVEFDAPRQRAQRFLQAKSSLRQCLRALKSGSLSSMPRLGETVWPYLLADPLPHLMGRIGHARRNPATRRRSGHPARAA
jgi:predicted ATP-grasp superfamily ATP-dependent carboligase